jgi:hypothetical protein
MTEREKTPKKQQDVLSYIEKYEPIAQPLIVVAFREKYASIGSARKNISRITSALHKRGLIYNTTHIPQKGYIKENIWHLKKKT